ncbi:DUF2993 domain-containing protein [Aetokthonos hydrillicola Thurmond2011]|uniref:DUF2993 domain-containing protein n=1 Tax=Aetokthonos hydrillicola Thurmond2011 TaxID=2712845 RepID=A0AAP5IEG7_9CYAN|nr:DUF2993 domain-containing protein [Aetokthonos hydrillicola]MBO3457193.1 DUF2993 domain-containing protein [Aetokthonos hydrillicola CCALA 1050]MBW4587544.1 DUF2993 domain-containing protein [Aetokthonos hydrillicola CCALA 1050]MDR9900190.1 DUF2993 domain-containing protein [Aetokthonos hydrillicola Thurmond2011]
MEFFTILLSSILGLVSVVGVVIDRTAENAIRSQFAKVGKLEVRVDNSPSYQVLQGRVERVLIAGRSLQLKQQNVRIALFELETDPIELELSSLKHKRYKLKRPLQAGVRLVLTQEDLNKLLQSPQLIGTLRKLNINSVSSQNPRANSGYNFINPQVKFLANNRLFFQVGLQEGKSKPLLISVESGVSIVSGRYIQLVNPFIAVDGQKVPDQFVKVILNNFNKQLDLGNLEGDGIQARILKLEMKPKQIEIATFLRIEPSSRLLETRGS